MALGWKVLVPGSLVWIVLVSSARALRSAAVTPSEVLVVGGIVLVMLLVVAFLLPQREDQDQPTHDEIPTAGSDYPLPPLDLVVPPTPARRAAVGAAVAGNADPATRQED